MSTGRSIKAIDDDTDEVFQTHVSAVSLDDSQFVTLKLVKKYPRVFKKELASWRVSYMTGPEDNTSATSPKTSSSCTERSSQANLT